PGRRRGGGAAPRRQRRAARGAPDPARVDRRHRAAPPGAGAPVLGGLPARLGGPHPLDPRRRDQVGRRGSGRAARMRVLLALLLLPVLREAREGRVEGLPQARVKTGLEVLVRDGFKPLQGKRVGIVTNHSGIDPERRSLIDLLAAGKGFTVTALFSP